MTDTTETLPTDLTATIASKSARLVDLMRERDDLLRAHRRRDHVLRDARDLIDAAGKRYRDRLADKLLAFGAPNSAALRLFSGPDADALCYLLGDQLKQALAKVAHDWPSAPIDRDERLDQLAHQIPELELELERIRTLFDDGTHP